MLGLCFERPAKPAVTFFSLGKQFTALRAEPDWRWLRDVPYISVRYTLKRQADAWQRTFKQGSGFPKFKARMGDDSFTLPDNVNIRTDANTGVTRLWVPKAGWMVLRRSGGNPYQGCSPAGGVRA